MKPCPFCSRRHGEPTDKCKWDWDGIARAEQQVRDKADRLPKCARCGNPMWFGQSTIHYACLGGRR